ncbi:MAG: hypothetical protein PHG61_02125 [Candidatus Marinimicrobia bacterium]|jgi:hypothetical protein|nr:hypothetical protein [Candidatus Neomarinimicrobiota bacterium]
MNNIGVAERKRDVQMLNRDQVLKGIEPLVVSQVRHVPSSSDTRVLLTDKNEIAIRPSHGAHSLIVDKAGHTPLMKFIGMPEIFEKHLEPGTYVAAATQLLQRKEHFTLVINNDQMITDIVSYGERDRISPVRVLDTIEKTIPVKGYNRLVFATRELVQLEAVGERMEPVVPGDLVQAGVLVRFSPVGIGVPRVQSYALRLDCTNGNCSDIHFAEFAGGGGGEGDDIWHWFRQNIRKAYNSLDKVVAEWRRLASEHIDPKDRASILEAIIKESRLPPETAATVRAMALENPPRNNWEAYNLITYASSHLLETPKQILQAQDTAVKFAGAETHGRVCPVCRHSRN